MGLFIHNISTESNPLDRRQRESGGGETKYGYPEDRPLNEGINEGTVEDRVEVFRLRNEIKEKKFWIKVIVTFVTLDLLLVGAILLTAHCGIPGKFPETKGKQETDFCLPCDDVYITKDDRKDNIYGFTQKKEGPKDVCCSQNGTDIRSIVNKFAAKTYRHNIALANEHRASSFWTIPAAHLIGIKRSKKDPSVILWESNSETSLIDRNILYKDGRLQVTTSGLYYIYSQVTFIDNSGHSTVQEGVNHTIHRVRPGGREELLLQTVHTNCYTSKNNGLIPSFLGAVLNVSEGDRMFVSVSDNLTCPFFLISFFVQPLVCIQ